jgi:hypothetical protein
VVLFVLDVTASKPYTNLAETATLVADSSEEEEEERRKVEEEETTDAELLADRFATGWMGEWSGYRRRSRLRRRSSWDGNV